MATFSYGETMESEILWKKPGMTVEEVKSIKRGEFLESARILGAEPVEMRFDDNFLRNPLSEEKHRLVAETIRRIRPHLVITHCLTELYHDHRLTSECVCRTARDLAADPEKLTESGLAPWNVKNFYFFEPQAGSAAIIGFLEHIYIDVSDVWDKKVRSLEPFWHSQTNNLDYYTQVARYCGAQAGVKYAERFIQYRPSKVLKLFPEPNQTE
jgi:4-oxalomesaconate hydratase